MQNQSGKRSRATDIRFAVVGPGRVGSCFARWLVESGARSVRVSGRSPAALDSPRPWPGATPDLWVPIESVATDDLDLLLLTVSDPAIEIVARRLSERPQAKVVLHAAGQFDARVLAPLRRLGSAVGSLHPLRAFVAGDRSPNAEGAWFAIDGDPEAVRMAERLAELFAGSAVHIEGEARRIYHLAATLAAGGVTTLMAVVEELLEAADLPPTLLQGYLRLAEGALAPIGAGEGPIGPLITGPAARGDVDSLDRQKAALSIAAPHLLPLVDELHRQTRRQCTRRTGSSREEVGKKSGLSRVGKPGRMKIPPPERGKRE